MPSLIQSLLFFLLSCALSNASAQGAAPYKAASIATQRVGEAYFSAYVNRDWDRLEPLVADQGGFADPTASLIFGGVNHVGKTATLKAFREGYAAITEMSFKRTRAFFSGSYAIFEGTLDWTLRLRSGKLVATKGMPLVTVLRIEGDRVVEHRDLADYHAYLEAHAKASGGG